MRDGQDVTRVYGVYHRLGFGAAFAVRDEVLLRRDDGEGRRLSSRKSGPWLKALDGGTPLAWRRINSPLKRWRRRTALAP